MTEKQHISKPEWGAEQDTMAGAVTQWAEAELGGLAQPEEMALGALTAAPNSYEKVIKQMEAGSSQQYIAGWQKSKF